MMTAPAYRAHPIRNFFRNEGNRWRRHPASALLRLLCRLSVLITIFALLAIVIDLLVKGIPHLTPELFSLKYTTENQSMLPAIINTLLIALVALLLAPLSVAGDLFASIIKRQCHVKDFGSIMPGHGGVMDRFDSILFVAPVMFILVHYLPLISG
mgnify:CR=1 FL=1